MAIAITMPKLGLTMNSGSVREWKKKVGDTVKTGEFLYSVATDKLTVEAQSPADGILLAIVVKDGQEVPVGGIIGYIGAAGENIPEQPAAVPTVASVPSAHAAAASQKPLDVPAVTGSSGIQASPKAKILAKEKGINLAKVSATGPMGWITSKDVLAAEIKVKASPAAARMAEAAGISLSSLSADRRVMKSDVEGAIAAMSAGAEDVRIPATHIRQVIAERMTYSVNTIPAVRYFADVDMTELNLMRERFNRRLDKQGVKISINDILMKLCAKLLTENPMLNASAETENGKVTSFILHKSVNIGLAVALPGGLIVPNIKNVQNKGLAEIARERQDLVERARSNNLKLDEFTGGTFTISSLGSVDVDSFTPIINPPEAAILGVGRTREKPVVLNGEIVVRPISVMCFAVDHRLLDGADAAKILERLKELIESPELYLL